MRSGGHACSTVPLTLELKELLVYVLYLVLRIYPIWAIIHRSINMGSLEEPPRTSLEDVEYDEFGDSLLRGIISTLMHSQYYQALINITQC